jgi:calcium-dependent protein kinase
MENNQKFNKELFVHKLETPLLDSYNVIYEIGKGAFSKVYEVRHKITGDIRACKYISKKDLKEEELKNLRKEFDFLKNIDHPNIIKIYELFETPNSIYLIMEKCNGGNLMYKIEERMTIGKYFDEKILSEVIRQITSAIKYCHDKGICHRDIKPENICFLNLGDMDNNSVKVIDFGFGKIIDSQKRINSQVGSALYIAPEVIKKNYTNKCDIWSLGAILYFLLAGKPPFIGSNNSETLIKISKMKVEFDEEWNKNISKEAKDLIEHMLVKEEERYSAEDVLNHPWIKKEKIFPKNSEVNEKKFKLYQKMDNFEKKIIMFIASRLNENEINNIKNFFVAFDKNNDGRISFDEFYNGIVKISDRKITKEEIQPIFNNIDTDENGTIEYTEFIASCIDENLYLNKDKLKEVFDAFDKDKYGKISIENIKSVLELDANSSKRCESLFNRLDKDKDKKIDFEDFIKMISKIISENLKK